MYTYIHIYIAWISTYIHTYIHAYILAYIHTCMYTNYVCRMTRSRCATVKVTYIQCIHACIPTWHGYTPSIFWNGRDRAMTCSFVCVCIHSSIWCTLYRLPRLTFHMLGIYLSMYLIYLIYFIYFSPHPPSFVYSTRLI